MDSKRIVITVSNNLVTDNRLAKTAASLEACGCEVLLLGRRWPSGSIPPGRAGKVRRFRLFFNRNLGFYSELNVRLFFYLLFVKVDVIWAVDLDTLPAAYLAARMRGKKLIYDSHEYFTELPELQDRPIVKRAWTYLQDHLITKVDVVITVSGSIADAYRDRYGVDAVLVRNMPLRPIAPMSIRELGDGPVIYYQGAMNVGRGLEEAIRSLKFLPGYRMIIAGRGSHEETIREEARRLGFEDRITFTGMLPFEALADEARKAHVGLCLMTKEALNHYYALPNRLFDYPALGLPVVASAFPDISKIVEKYKIGLLVDDLQPETLAAAIREACENRELRKLWKSTLPAAAEQLNWEKEAEVFKKLI